MLVIPAEAGTSGRKGAALYAHEIPAFAGMTASARLVSARERNRSAQIAAQAMASELWISQPSAWFLSGE
jgi:hypothetical protein